MLRNTSNWVAILLAATLATALAAPPQARAAGDEMVYAACYIFTAGGDRTAISFPPHKIDRHVLYNIYTEAQLEDENTGAARANGYRSARCNAFATPEKAEAWYRESGYNMVKRLDWPKGYWPGEKPALDPRGPWAACLKSQAGGPRITPAFQTDVPNHRAQLDADAVARWGGSDYVDCDYGQTREEVERRIRNHYTSPPRDWPLPWLGGKSPAPPKPAAAPQPASAPSLTVKTDTSAKDAAKAWDEQVRKTLAAEAQKKVEIAAKQAQADAKLKADYEAFFAERRKQGRAQ